MGPVIVIYMFYHRYNTITKGDSFYDFYFVSHGNLVVPKQDLLLKKRLCCYLS